MFKDHHADNHYDLSFYLQDIKSLAQTVVQGVKLCG